MSAIITSGNMDQMIAAYGSEYLINHGLVLPVTCDECGGSGEYVFNTDPRRDPVNDQVKPCKCCDGTGTVLELVEPVDEDEH